MPVLVDGSVWSLALRRSAPDQTHQSALNRLIVAGEVRIIGPIRQECLSGIANPVISGGCAIACGRLRIFLYFGTTTNSPPPSTTRAGRVAFKGPTLTF